jgi:DNA-binding transcriptional ArsR family regulator
MLPLGPDGDTVRRPAKQAAPVFAALGDETRLRLVIRLSREGPLSISRLAAGSSVTRQAVSKHLKVLAGAGIASGSKRGREQVWELQSRPLLTAREYLDDLSAQWDEALGRLKRMVEGQEPGSD